MLLASYGRVAWAAPPTDEGTRPLRVTIDVSAIAEDDAPHIERFTEEQIEPVLRDAAYARSSDAGDAVEIRIDYVERKDLLYAIYVDVYDDGEKIEPGIDWFVCKFCPQGMVAEAVAEHLPAALDLLAEHEAKAAAADETPGTLGEPADPQGGSPTKPRPIGWLGITGAVVATGGLATTVAGIVQLSKGEVVIPTQASQRRVQDFRPQGGALLGIGLGAMALGTAAVVVDVVRRRRSRNHARVAPSVLPSGVGIAVGGRF
ncbi:MAG: hypothetical protein K0V04_28255 [Deltaproteobacteria bacterium]|nr:hypothetical protein [Deltaproteobacteria bacterium]